MFKSHAANKVYHLAKATVGKSDSIIDVGKMTLIIVWNECDNSQLFIYFVVLILFL